MDFVFGFLVKKTLKKFIFFDNNIKKYCTRNPLESSTHPGLQSKTSPSLFSLLSKLE